MRSKLNPDGTRIRVLRMERGWTQEQLAEIAGVSSRTVQRAESASCASFDTVRALAGAFEMDFGQLLAPGTDGVSNPNPPMIGTADRIDSAPEIELIPACLPNTTERRRWAPPLLSISTLVLGLAAGISLAPHFKMDKEIGSFVSSSVSPITRQIESSREPVHPVMIQTQKEKQTGKAASVFMKTTVPGHNPHAMVVPPDLSPAEQSAETMTAADSGLGDSIQHAQESGSLGLYLQSESQIPELLIPTTSLAGELLILPENRGLDEPDPGAVRQAVDLAAKKTGAAVSKVRASLKRVF
jgi:transcriptional regulator with XRE-family HTH domain